MSIESFPDTGTYTMVAEIVCEDELTSTRYFIAYTSQTTIKDILEDGASTLNLDIGDYELYIEYPVGFPGIDLRHQIDKLEYVRTPIFLSDDNFVACIKCAQMMAIKNPGNSTITAELASREYAHLFRVSIVI